MFDTGKGKGISSFDSRSDVSLDATDTHEFPQLTVSVISDPEIIRKSHFLWRCDKHAIRESMHLPPAKARNYTLALERV